MWTRLGGTNLLLVSIEAICLWAIVSPFRASNESTLFTLYSVSHSSFCHLEVVVVAEEEERRTKAEFCVIRGHFVECQTLTVKRKKRAPPPAPSTINNTNSIRWNRLPALRKVNSLFLRTRTFTIKTSAKKIVPWYKSEHTPRVTKNTSNEKNLRTRYQ